MLACDRTDKASQTNLGVLQSGTGLHHPPPGSASVLVDAHHLSGRPSALRLHVAHPVSGSPGFSPAPGSPESRLSGPLVIRDSREDAGKRGH